MIKLLKNKTLLLACTGRIYTYESTVILGCQAFLTANSINSKHTIAVEDIKSYINENSLVYEEMFKKFAQHIIQDDTLTEESYKYLTALINEDYTTIDIMNDEDDEPDNYLKTYLVINSKNKDDIGTVAKILHYKYFEADGETPACEQEVVTFNKFLEEFPEGFSSVLDK